jgi:uncharacterized BrkB/YihY/UPF0761 family membrane protein
MRRIVTLLLVLVGLVLMVVGYLNSAPWGSSSVADGDPVFAGAPTLFILGIVVILSAPVFYELLPSRDDDRVG